MVNIVNVKVYYDHCLILCLVLSEFNGSLVWCKKRIRLIYQIKQPTSLFLAVYNGETLVIFFLYISLQNDWVYFIPWFFSCEQSVKDTAVLNYHMTHSSYDVAFKFTVRKNKKKIYLYYTGGNKSLITTISLRDFKR